jgi:AcrR family transcriptional regulator
MKAAGELLGEVGFEKLTTNTICTRAGLTPPALYRYFRDKYDVLEALARRLLKKHMAAYAAWFAQGGTWADPANRAAALEDWFRTSSEVTASEPGAIWTLRALRALPHLAHIRLEFQRQAADQLFEFYRRVYPDIPPKLLWCRTRVMAEFGFVVDEFALEEDRIPPEVLFHEAARVLGVPYDYEPPGSKPLSSKYTGR